MFPLRGLLCLACAFFFVQVSRAQITSVTNSTSTPTPGVGHDYIKSLNEIVDPANGSVSVRIDAGTPNGRGIALPFYFAYDSNGVHFPGLSLPSESFGVWTSNSPSVAPSPFASAGWSYSVPSVSFSNYFVLHTNPNNGRQYSCFYWLDFVFQDPSGGRHNLSLGWNTQSTVSCQDGLGDNSLSPEYPTGGDGRYRAALVTTGSLQTIVGITATGLNISDADGTVFHFNLPFPCTSCSGTQNVTVLPTYVEDRNGNQTSVRLSSGNYAVTDDLGRTQVSTSGFGATGNTVTVSGLSQPYSLTWGTASSNFTVSETMNTGACQFPQPGSITQPVITAITLPNGNQYQFFYDSVYGLLSKIVYPSGGYVSYSWGLNTQSAHLYLVPTSTHFCSHVYDAIYDKPAILHRYVSFDGTNIALQQDFSYSTTWGAQFGIWTAKQTAITNNDKVLGTSYQTIYTYYSNFFASGQPYDINAIDPQLTFEQSTSYYGTSGGLLKTVTKNWFDVFVSACQLQTLDTGQISGTFYAYGPGDQLTDKKEYDLGQLTTTSTCTSPSPGPPPSPTPVRETATNYQSFANTPIYPAGPSIFDRGCSVITYGNGVRVAESDSFYDGSLSTTPCSTATTQTLPGTGNYAGHDETLYGTNASVPRGNVTKVIRKCLLSCTDSTTTFSYDETGQVLTSMDACGNATCGDMTGTNHTTTYSYADNFDSNPSTNTNAYLTQITDPLGHTSSFKYAYSDGQLISSTDQNAKITSYLYADSLRRLTETDYADGGKTTISYSDTDPSPSVTTTRLIATTPSTVNLSTTSIMDGLGHVTQTQLTTDPDGTDFTDITFDGMGRVWKQSNPHRSSALPTDGTTTNFHDALGRICLVVPPDGTLPTGNTCPTSQPSNTVFTTYSGNTTIVTDQTGKSRKSITDALGRLTQAFEDPAGFNYEADYTYDAFGNLLTVNQRGGPPTRPTGAPALSRTTRCLAF